MLAHEMALMFKHDFNERDIISMNMLRILISCKPLSGGA